LVEILENISPYEVDAELCRRSFYHFFVEFWPTIVADELKDNWHIEYICNELQVVGERIIARQDKEYDLIINVPPGSSKSTICTQIFPAWLWVRDSSLKVISASYSDTLSTQHAVKSRDLLKSDKFKAFYGSLFDFKRDSDNKTYYENTEGGLRAATSVGGTITGIHAHILIIDDPIKPSQAESEKARKTANDWMDKTLSTRKVDKKLTPTILIMQRLHDQDPTGYILKKENKKVKHICLPAEVSSKVSPPELIDRYVDGLLDPVRMDRKALEGAKVDLGSNAYAGQFGQATAPDEGGMIKKAWFRKISYIDFIKLNPKPDFFFDTAYTEEQKNDPTALMAAWYFNNELYIFNSEEQWLEFPELLKYIPSFGERNLYQVKAKFLVEPKASGKSVVQSFKKTPYNFIELDSPVGDKRMRVSGITPFLESGRCILVEGVWNEQFILQCSTFPNAEHDDQLDNLTNAINYYESKPQGRSRWNM
jgi:predicted phage terminase large subunit-like protein